MTQIDIKSLIDKKIHLGHKVKSINFRLYRYITAIVNNIAIINIERSLSHLKKSCSFISDISANAVTFLFISQKRYSPLTRNIKYIDSKYNPGFFTNNMHNIDAVVITDESGRSNIVEEAGMLYIPTISIVDTNNQTKLVNYPIISNNDSKDIVNMYNLLFIDVINTSRRNNKLSFKYKYIIND